MGRLVAFAASELPLHPATSGGLRSPLCSVATGKVSLRTAIYEQTLLTFGSLLIAGVLKLAMVETPLLAVQRCALSDCEAGRSVLREDIVIMMIETVCL
jgi:hypothetical protein